ncbi:MAG: hypothetical protein KF801_01820 [Cryobacterium sp.]|nr:hypothetical protein [Cryobacterium sp.]
MTHFSPLAGKPDLPENYHTLTWELKKTGGSVRLALIQDNNPSEHAAEHSQAMWDRVLADVKMIAERD